MKAKARLLLRQRLPLDESSFVEMVVWEVPVPVRESSHNFKYHLAYIVNESCVMRFDNEAGKGDHYHHGKDEFSISFTSLDDLLQQFWQMLETIRNEDT